MDLRCRILDWRPASLAVLAVAALGFVAACGGDDDDDGGGADSDPVEVGVAGTATVESDLAKEINAALIPVEMAEGKRIGSVDAPITIEAYEDFGCPHCLEFTAEIEPIILQEYVVPGKASFEYKYFPLRQQTGTAAIAAQCAAEQDKFWPFHRALFIAQAEANAKVGPPLSEAFSVANLRSIAEAVALDTAVFDTCVEGDSAVDVVQAELQKANELALPGTPSFVINGKVTPGPETAEGWRELLDGLAE